MMKTNTLQYEPQFSSELLEYYWGKDWPGLKSHYSDGTPVKERGYPKWEQYSDEQKAEILELQTLIHSHAIEAREELLTGLLRYGDSININIIEEKLAKLQELKEGKS